VAIDFETLADLAQLAVAAYDNGNPVHTQLPDGWDVLDLADLGLTAEPFVPVIGAPWLEYNQNGYFHYVAPGIDAEAFAVRIGNDVVIAFRGTEPPFSGLLADLLTDVGIILGRLGDALLGLAPFIDAVQAYVANNPGTRLLATGHSLGGAMAETLFEQGGLAGGAGFGSPGISLFSRSGGNPNFIHIARETDWVANLFDQSHVGTSVYLVGDGLSFIYPPFASHASDVYRNQMALLAGSAAFDGILPQSLNSAPIYAAHPDQPIMAGTDLFGSQAIIGSNFGDTIDGTTAGVLFSSDSGLRIGGGGGFDSILGGIAHDTLAGDAGDDTIKGGSGGDLIYGGTGNDWIEEIEGTSIWLTKGDTINGDGGNDTINAGTGNNTVYGGTGNDSIWAGSGNDRLFGQEDNDTIHASDGADSLYGGPGADHLYGDESNDDVRGEVGADSLYGGSGADTLYGGSENDQLWGEGGFDTLIGEQGADRFHIDPGAYAASGPIQIDEIRDYNQGNGSFSDAEGDVIDISALVAQYGGTGQPESSLWRLMPYGGATYLEVDPDGSGALGWRSLALLTGVNPGDNIRVYTGTGDAETPPPAQPVPSAPGSYTISPSSRVVNEGTGTISFTITRPTTVNAETVYVSTTINRGSLNDGDYDGWLNEAVTFAAGDATETVTITINDDNDDETAEQFGLIVQSSPSQPASQYLAQASFTIIDDDEASGGEFTEGSDTVWLDPPPYGGAGYDGLGGNDTAVLDFRSLASGFTIYFYNGTLTANTGGASPMTIVNVENYVVFGSNEYDSIDLGGIGGIILARGGNDNIWGSSGIDVIDAGSGDDNIYNIGLGDVVEGGSGNDILYFDVSGSADDHVINLATGQGAGGPWTGIERVSGTLGSGDDTIIAGIQIESLYDYGGTDRIELDYSGTLPDGRTATYLSLSLRDGNNEYVTLSDNSTYPSFILYGFESSRIIATIGNDNIYGGDAGNYLSGIDGNDTLYGGNASDTLLGGNGNDQLTGDSGADSLDGGEGDDYLDPGSGNDTVDGGEGNDTVYFTGNRADYLITYLGNGAWRIADNRAGAPDGEDTVSGVEGLQFADQLLARPFLPVVNLNLAGTAGADSLVGDSGDDTISGSGGDDTLVGEEGADTLTGGSGNDSILGGGGNDTLDGGFGNDSLDGGAGDDTFLIGASSGVDAVFGGSGQDRIVATAANAVIAISQLSGVEEIDGAGLANVRIVATAAAERLDFSTIQISGIAAIDGGNGNDTIIGSAGNDTIIGNFGNDSLDGGAGDDTFLIGLSSGVDIFAGGSGNDRIAASAANAVIAFSQISGIETIDGAGLANVRIGGSAASDLMDFSAIALTGISAIDGGNGNDTIIGTAGADSVIGGSGQDSLLGAGGNDTLDGGIGNDWLDGGSGTNSLIGGDGNDTFIARSSSDKVVEASNAGIDTILTDLASYSLAALTQVENLSYTGGGSATLTGNGLANRVAGGSGNDSLSGGSGNDTLTGSAGNDTLTGSFGNDSLDGGDGNDLFSIGTAAGTDTFIGGSGQDRILATAANAVIGIGQISGIETIDGGAFANVRIVATAASELLDFGSTTLIGIAAIDGGNGKDTINGSAASDTIIGGFGNDSMNGGDGDDTFLVGTSSGSDTFLGGSGHDRIVATAANAVITISAMGGIEAIDGAGFANVRIAGTAGLDQMDFSAVTLTGIAAIQGGNGKDTITGSASDDTIVGGNGQDLMTGGAGADTFAFATTAESSRTTPDTISDFVHGTDRIDLSAIDGDGTAGSVNMFNWIGSAAFTGTAGELRFALSGGNTLIMGDTNGDGVADIQIVLSGSVTVASGDFLL
jgi:Ca2+-binding RTX toxin-like protein